MAVTGYYTVPDQYAGKTLTQIQSESGLPFRSDTLGGMLGVDPNTPLAKGQSLAFTGDPTNTGSGEVQAVGKLFGSATSPAIKSAQDANNFTIQANQPYIQQLQGQQQSTGDAYSSIIHDILNAGQNAQDQNTVNLKREYAARGVPTDSLSAEQDLTKSNSQVQQPYLAQADTATGNRVGALNAISSAIGQLQAGSPASAIQAGLSQEQMNNTVAQQQAELALQKSQQTFQQSYIPTAYGVYNVNTGQFVGQNSVNSAINSALGGTGSSTTPTNTPTNTSTNTTTPPNVPITQKGADGRTYQWDAAQGGWVPLNGILNTPPSNAVSSNTNNYLGNYA